MRDAGRPAGPPGRLGRSAPDRSSPVTTITLDRDTAARIRAAGAPVSLVDPDGALLFGPAVPAAAPGAAADGVAADGWTADEIEAAKASVAAGGPRYTSAGVWARIFDKYGRPGEVRPGTGSGGET